MGFHVDLKELTKAAQKLQQEANQLEEQLATAKNQVNHIISTEALQGKTGQAIYQQLNNVDAAILVGLRDTTKLLASDLASLVAEFQATVGETTSDAVLDEDYLNQLKDNLTTYQNQHGVHEESISSIYAGISDLISLSGPQSQYDTDTATAMQDLSNTIDKVTSFDGASTEPNSEALLAAVNSKVNQVSQTTALSYTDSQYLSFISDVDFAKGIKSIDKQITQQEKLAQEQAEKEAKANWAKQHPVVALLQTISDETTKLFQWANQEVQDYDLNIPGANYVKDQISLRLGFISKACETVGDLAIGTAQLSQLVFEGVEWGRNTVWKKETPQWIKDDVVGTAMTIATTTSFVNRLQLGDTNAWKALYKGLEESTSQIANNIISGNNFEIGGYLFDVVTLVYPGTAASELKYVDEASNLAKLAETSEIASTVGKVEDGVKVSKFDRLFRKLNKGNTNSVTIDDIKVSDTYFPTAKRYDEKVIVNYASQIKEHYTQQDVEYLTQLTTHNSDSKTALLGLFKANSVLSYEQMAYVNNFTYFDAGNDGWRAISKINSELPYQVNDEFLASQINAEKNFILTSNPYTARYIADTQKIGISYANEIDLLRELGYTIEPFGEYWRAIK